MRASIDELFTTEELETMAFRAEVAAAQRPGVQLVPCFSASAEWEWPAGKWVFTAVPTPAFEFTLSWIDE